jgi:hypothetical protein
MGVLRSSGTEAGEPRGRSICFEINCMARKQLRKHPGEHDDVLQQILRQQLLVFPHDQYGADALAPLDGRVPGRRVDVQRGRGVVIEMGVARELERGLGRQSASKQGDTKEHGER